MSTKLSIKVPRFELAEVVRANPVGFVGDTPIRLHQVFHDLELMGYIFRVGEVWVGKRTTPQWNRRSVQGVTNVLYQCRGHDQPELWISNHGADPCEHVCEHIRGVHALEDFPVGKVPSINIKNARHIWFKGIDSIGYSTGSLHLVFLIHLFPLDGRGLGYAFEVEETAVDKFPVGKSDTDGYWCAQHGGRIIRGSSPRWRSDQPTTSDYYCNHIRAIHELNGYPTRGNGYPTRGNGYEILVDYTA